LDLRRFLDLDLFLGHGEQMVVVVDVEATLFVYILPDRNRTLRLHNAALFSHPSVLSFVKEQRFWEFIPV
jgi:hypothetical protein